MNKHPKTLDILQVHITTLKAMKDHVCLSLMQNQLHINSILYVCKEVFPHNLAPVLLFQTIFDFFTLSNLSF